MTDILILDMDGTVRIKKGGTPGDIKAGFISHPEDQEIIPGATKAIEVYAKEGWLIVGCSNQGGVAAGHKTIEECIDEQLQTLILVPDLHQICFCPDYEGEKMGIVYRDAYCPIIGRDFIFLGDKILSPFRKPNTGMIDYVRLTYKCDRLLFVGGRPEDEQAAEEAGIDFQWAKDWWR